MAATSQHIPPLSPLGQDQLPVSENVLLRFVKAHLRFIVVIIGLFILAAVTYALIHYFEKRAVENDQIKLTRLLKQAPSTAERIKALELMLPSTVDQVRPSVAFELVRAGIEENNATVIEKGWTALAAAAAGLDIGPEMGVVAAMGKASVLAENNDMAGALVVLKEQRLSAPSSFKPFILDRLAALATAAGDNATAVEAYSELRTFDPRNVVEYDRRIAALQGQPADELKAGSESQ